MVKPVMVQSDSDDDVALVDIMRQRFGKNATPQACVDESTKKAKTTRLSAVEEVYR